MLSWFLSLYCDAVHQLRAAEAMNSPPVACLSRGSIVTVLKSKVSSKHDLLSRRVLVQHVDAGADVDTDNAGARGRSGRDGGPKQGEGATAKGWASIQSKDGYQILSPLTLLCYGPSTRWGWTRPIVRTCGHAAHLRCVETHTLSLFQKAGLDQPYDGRFAANIDDGEFLCPLCKQLSNILVPRDRSFAARKRDVDTADGAKLMSQKKMLSSSVHSAPSLRRALTRIVRPGNSGRQRDDAAFKATRHFGEQLYQAMLISWDRSSRRRQQKAWDPLVRQWDFEEQDDNEAGMMVDSEEGGG